MSFVNLGIEVYTNPSNGKPVSGGFIYVGEPDTDPTVAINQKTVQLLQESGVLVATSQPISIGAGGIPLYLGSPVRLVVSGDYSITVQDKNTTQVYYVPTGNLFVAGASTLNTDLAANAGTIYGQIATTSGETSVGDGGGGTFYFIPTASLTALDTALIAIDRYEDDYISTISASGYWKREQKDLRTVAIAGLPIKSADISLSYASASTLQLEEGVYFYKEYTAALANFNLYGLGTDRTILMPDSTILLDDDFSYYNDTHKRTAYTGHIPEIIFDRNLKKYTISESNMFYANRNYAGGTGETVKVLSYTAGTKSALFDIFCESDVLAYTTGKILTDSFIRLNGWFTTRRYDFGYVTASNIVGQQIMDFEQDQLVDATQLGRSHTAAGYGNKFKLCNILEELDRDSFCVKGGFLYVPNEMDYVIVPKEDRLFNSTGSNTVDISGIHFVGSSYYDNERTGGLQANHTVQTWSRGFVRFIDSDNITVSGCKFSKTERTTVTTYLTIDQLGGATNSYEQLLHGGHVITGNYFDEVGCGGAALIGYDVKINNNYFKNCGIMDGSKPIAHTEGLLTEINDNIFDGIYSYAAMPNEIVDIKTDADPIGVNTFYLNATHPTQAVPNYILRNTFINNGKTDKPMYAYNGDSAVIYSYYGLDVETEIAYNTINNVEGYRQKGIMLDGFASLTNVHDNIIHKRDDHCILVTPATEAQVIASSAAGQFVYQSLTVDNNICCGSVYYFRLDSYGAGTPTNNTFTGNSFDFYKAENFLVRSYYEAQNEHLPYRDQGENVVIYKYLTIGDGLNTSEKLLYTAGVKIMPPAYIEQAEDKYMYYKNLGQVVKGEVYLNEDNEQFLALDTISGVESVLLQNLLKNGSTDSSVIVTGDLEIEISRSWSTVGYSLKSITPASFAADIGAGVITDGLTLLSAGNINTWNIPSRDLVIPTYNVNSSAVVMTGAESVAVILDTSSAIKVFRAATAKTQYFIAPCSNSILVPPVKGIVTPLVYDFAVDGGVVGSITIGSLPDNTIITKAVYTVDTLFTSAGAATVSLSIEVDDVDGVLAPTVYNNAIFTVGAHTAIQDGARVNYSVQTTAVRNIVLTIGTANLTAGKISLYYEYLTN